MTEETGRHSTHWWLRYIGGGERELPRKLPDFWVFWLEVLVGHQHYCSGWEGKEDRENSVASEFSCRPAERGYIQRELSRWVDSMGVEFRRVFPAGEHRFQRRRPSKYER